MKPRDFYCDILRELGEEPNFYLSKSKLMLEQVLNYRALQKDKALVVIIDEAHDISPSMLLELRFALNHQMDSSSLRSAHSSSIPLTGSDCPGVCNVYSSPNEACWTDHPCFRG